VRYVVLSALAACYSPNPPVGAKCASGNTCPDPLVCVSSPQGAVCAEPGTIFADAASPDAPIDAGVDAVPIDTPVARALLQQERSNYVEGAASLDITFGTEPAIGDLLVMVGATPGGLLDSVTGAGTTWTKATGSSANSNIEIWYGLKTASGSTVTIARSAAATDTYFANVSEWSNISATTPFDSAQANFGTTSPASSGTTQATHTPDLLIFGVSDVTPNTFGTPGAGTWTPLASVGPTPSYVENVWYRNASLVTGYSPTVSETGNHWDAAIAAFEAGN
jgi:hypothetical protein